MNSCYESNYNKYNWLLFYELDEFLYLKNYNNIKLYLINPLFDKCQSIQLNWVHMSDNNHLYYENKPLKERFPEKGKNVVNGQYNKICFVKSMIKGHLKNFNITHNHLLSKKLKACNGFGGKPELKGILSLQPDYNYYYINHYYGKSIQEFVEKIKRGDFLRGNSKEIIEWAIGKFFYVNEVTKEKIKYLRDNLGYEYNLSIYENELMK